MASNQQNQNKVSNTTFNTSGSQTSNQNQTNTQNTNQTQQQNAQKNSWLLNMPGMNQLVNRVTNEMNQVNIPQYQLANLNDSQLAALNVLQQGRNNQQMQQVLGQYQKQAAGFTNYGEQQAQINQLAQGYYQGDLVNQNKQALQQDINRQLSGQVNQLNQGAINTGNMASSRAGIAQGVMTRGAQESYAKGAADIENSARNSAYNMAYQQYNQGQSNLYTSLGQQANLSQTLANWDQQDAQTKFNAAQQIQKQQQQQYDLGRSNNILSQTPSLQALQQYLPALSSLANFGVNTSGTASGNTSSTGSMANTVNTSGSQSNTGAENINTSGSQSGDTATNWGELGSTLAGQTAGSFLQPVASAFGSAVSNGNGGQWLASLF